MKVYLFNLQLNDRYRHPKLVRERSFHCEDGSTFHSPESVYKLAVDVLHLNSKAEEYTYAICFDTAMQRIQGIFEVSHGSIDCSILSPREVLIRALLCGTSRIILLHNHPSGNSKPSKEDIDLTNRMKTACQLIGIHLIDHIIIGNGNYCSLQTSNLL